MSFDLYLSCFRDGEAATFDRAVLERALAPHVARRDQNFLLVDAGDGTSHVHVEDVPAIHHLNVNHPGGEVIFDLVVALAAETRSAIFWADEPPCLAVTDEAVVPHLHPDMVPSLGPPRIVRTGADLLRAICGGPQA